MGVSLTLIHTNESTINKTMRIFVVRLALLGKNESTINKNMLINGGQLGPVRQKCVNDRQEYLDRYCFMYCSLAILGKYV